MALGQQHAELRREGHDQHPERDRHRVQRDPHDEQDQCRPAGGERHRDERDEHPPAVTAERHRQHQRDRQQTGQQRQQAPPGVGHLRPRAGRQHRQAYQAGGDPRGRVQARAHRFDHPLLLGQAHQAHPEGERGLAVVAGDHVLGEVRRDHLQQCFHLTRAQLFGAGARAALPREQVRQREGRAQSCLAAAVGGAEAEVREHLPLVGAHPFDRRRPCDVLAGHEQVDFPAHAAGVLERPQRLQRAEVLGNELGDVGLHAGLRTQRPPRQREHRARSTALGGDGAPRCRVRLSTGPA